MDAVCIPGGSLARVAAEHEEREREALAVEELGAGAVGLDGPRAREILWLLEDGPVEVGQLARLTELRVEVLERYLLALGRAGRILFATQRLRKIVRHFASVA